MRRLIVFALFGLFVSGDAAFPQAHAVPRPVPRVVPPGPRPPLVARPFIARPFFLRTPGFPRPWFAAPPLPGVQYQPLWHLAPQPYPLWNPFWNSTPWPPYEFLPRMTTSHPELVFNDGTTYMVTDYWRQDDQLHFTTIEEGATKSVEHTVPFSSLDVQRTTDADSARGFRFVLRDEPLEPWLRDHPSPTPR
jgi:hypothetical protein